MAGADRMTIEEVVKRVLLDEHADVIREAVKAVAAELMELEVSELIGAQRGAQGGESRGAQCPGGGAAGDAAGEQAAAEEGALERLVAVHAPAAEPRDLAGCVHAGQRRAR